MTDQTEDRIPVIVGVGEFSDHPKEIAAGLEPLALMVQALTRAEQDSGGRLLHDIDSLDIVNFLSWRYHDPAKLLSDRLGIAPKHCYYGPVGGESPIRYIHEAAQRIARGESRVAAICGAEAQSTATKAERAGVTLPWPPFAHDAPEPLRGANYQRPMAATLGIAKPVTVYPFYEAATAAHWGLTPREAAEESGELWARYAAVAAQNPEAWIKKAYTPAEITTPTPDNRLIAWPYTKLMVANPMVNQAAAILVTSLAKARAAGIPEDRMVHIHGGASAEEPRDYLDRDQFYESHAQNAVLTAAMDLANDKGFDAIELYRLLSLRAKDGAADARPRRRRDAHGNRRPHLLRCTAQRLHGACRLRHGAQDPRRRDNRPALWPGWLRHQTSCAGAVVATSQGRAGTGHQRAGRGRP